MPLSQGGLPRAKLRASAAKPLLSLEQGRLKLTSKCHHRFEVAVGTSV